MLYRVFSSDGSGMFEGIQRSLTDALKKLRGRGRLTEANIRDGLQRSPPRPARRRRQLQRRQRRSSSASPRSRSARKCCAPSTPASRSSASSTTSWSRLMGPVDHRFHFAKDRPTVLMLCGLQGSGKTTTAGKLALTAARQARPQAAARRRRLAASRRRRAAQGPRRAAQASRSTAKAPADGKGRPGRRLPQRRRPRQAARCSTRSSSTPPAGCTSTRCRWTS